MRARVLFILAILCSVPAFAQTAAIQGFCNLGGSQAKTSGFDSTNYQQGIVPSCQITVYLTGTTTKATIYSDSSNTPLSNPFTAAATGSSAPGQWIFWAAINQGYDAVMSGGIAPNTYPQPVTLTDLFPGQFFTPPFTTQTNSTPNASQSRLNFSNSPTVTWSNPSGGDELATVLVSGGFQMFVPDPLGTQSVLVTATAVTTSDDGDPVHCSVGADTTSGSIFITTTTNTGCSAVPGATITWSNFTLPAYVVPANVTAVYAVGQAGFSVFSQIVNISCPQSGTALMNGGTNGTDTGVLKPYSVLLAGVTGANVGTVSCTAVMAANAGGNSVPFLFNIPFIALRVYYTGTAPPASNTVNVTAPLYINKATNSLGVSAINLGSSGDGGVIGLLPQASIAPPTQTTVTGTTAGTAVWTQPQQFATWKQAAIYLNGYENTTATAQTITLPASFGTISAVLTDSGTCTGVTISGAIITLPASMGAAQTGLCEIRGW